MSSLIALEDSLAKHYGSTMVGAVDSTFNANTPNFVKINNVSIVTTNNTIDTPSHQFAVDSEGNPLFHNHLNQVVDNLNQSFVKIENNVVIVVGDKSDGEDTRVENGGSNNFVKIIA